MISGRKLLSSVTIFLHCFSASITGSVCLHTAPIGKCVCTTPIFSGHSCCLGAKRLDSQHIGDVAGRKYTTFLCNQTHSIHNLSGTANRKVGIAGCFYACTVLHFIFISYSEVCRYAAREIMPTHNEVLCFAQNEVKCAINTCEANFTTQ